MSELRSAVQMWLFILRSCWLWLAMWCWLLWNTFEGLGPSLSLEHNGTVQFEAFLGVCGWLTSGAIMLAGSSSHRAFWRGRPWSWETVVGCKLVLLTLVMGVLPLWLEVRLVPETLWLTSWSFWLDGLITFMAGAILPAALAAFFPSWAGFLTASIGLGLAAQAIGYVLFAFDLGEYLATAPVTGSAILVLAMVGAWLAYRRPSNRRLPWIVIALWAITVPVGGLWGHLEKATGHPPNPSVVGEAVEDRSARPGLEGPTLQRPEGLRSLAGADFYQLYARVALEDSDRPSESSGEARSGSVRWLGSRWIAEDGAVWRTRSKAQMSLLSYGNPSIGDEILAEPSEQGPVLVIPAQEIAAVADRPGRLELDVVFAERRPEMVGRLRLLSGAFVALDGGVLRVHEARRQGDRYVLRLGFSEVVTGQSFVAEPPTVPSFHLPGWRLLKPSAATSADPQEAWHQGHHFKVLLRQVATIFPSFFRLQYFLFQDQSFVPEPSVGGGEGADAYGRDVPVPDYLELWQITESESDRRTLVLSGVTLAELDGSSEVLTRFHERELKAFRSAEGARQ